MIDAVGTLEPPPSPEELYDGFGIEEHVEFWVNVGECPTCGRVDRVDLRAWVLGPDWATPDPTHITPDALADVVTAFGLDDKRFDGTTYLTDAHRLTVFAVLLTCPAERCRRTVLHLVSYGEFQPARYMSFNLGAIGVTIAG
jgi:hypothetical protein